MSKTYLARETGKRKSSVAVVSLDSGSGKIVVNSRNVEMYFPVPINQKIVFEALQLTNTVSQFDIKIKVIGGGPSGQAGAIRHAIAKALCTINPDFRQILKKNKYLTRDSRVKERKKYGLKAARRAPQFCKR